MTVVTQTAATDNANGSDWQEALIEPSSIDLPKTYWIHIQLLFEPSDNGGSAKYVGCAQTLVPNLAAD